MLQLYLLNIAEKIILVEKGANLFHTINLFVNSAIIITIKNIEQFKQFVSKQVTVYGKDWLHEVSLRNFWRHRKVRLTSMVDYAESKTPPLKTRRGF